MDDRVRRPQAAHCYTADTLYQIATLRKHNEAFERLLSFIPAKFYLAEDPNKVRLSALSIACERLKRGGAGHR